MPSCSSATAGVHGHKSGSCPRPAALFAFELLTRDDAVYSVRHLMLMMPMPRPRPWRSYGRLMLLGRLAALRLECYPSAQLHPTPSPYSHSQAGIGRLAQRLNCPTVYLEHFQLTWALVLGSPEAWYQATFPTTITTLPSSRATNQYPDSSGSHSSRPKTGGWDGRASWRLYPSASVRQGRGITSSRCPDCLQPSR